MGMRINTNVTSLAAQRTLGLNTRNMNDNLRKMSSGERITRASDDAETISWIKAGVRRHSPRWVLLSNRGPWMTARICSVGPRQQEFG